MIGNVLYTFYVSIYVCMYVLILPNKYQSINQSLGFTVFTTNFKIFLLSSMGNAIPSAIEITFIYCYLPIRAKNGIALLPCIFESYVVFDFFRFPVWQHPLYC